MVLRVLFLLVAYAVVLTPMVQAKAVDLAIEYNNAGVRKMNKGHYQDAVRDFDEALRIKSKYIVALSNRGIAKQNIGDNQSAINDFNKALQLDASSILAGKNIFYRALAKEALGDHIGAEEDFEKGMQLDPQIARTHRAHNLSAMIKVAKDDLEGAIADYSKAIQLSPNNADYFHRRGLAKENAGKLNEAKLDFEQERRIRTNSAKPR